MGLLRVGRVEHAFATHLSSVIAAPPPWRQTCSMGSHFLVSGVAVGSFAARGGDHSNWLLRNCLIEVEFLRRPETVLVHGLAGAGSVPCRAVSFLLGQACGGRTTVRRQAERRHAQAGVLLDVATDLGPLLGCFRLIGDHHRGVVFICRRQLLLRL